MGNLDVRWIHGEKTDPPIQTHRYDENTWILRQSKTVNFEAPFLYLLFGNDRALLLDTGATKEPERFPLRATVDGIVDSWLAEHPREGYGLTVAHTHAHRDHIAGDGQFADRPLTTVVGTDLDAVLSFYGFTDWPTEVVTYDLGGRVLELTGIPGHHPTSVAIFDPATGFLFTGDTVLPGRLYGFDMPALVASMDHLVAFAAARPVTHVLGCHVEMSRRPGRDYPIGATYQPDEAPLPMTVDQLSAMRDATHAAAARPGRYVSADFIVFHLTGTGWRTRARLTAHALRQRLTSR